MKQCGRCKIEKSNDAEHFVTCRGKTRSWCRACNGEYQAERRKATPEKVRAQGKEATGRYRMRHPDRVKAQSDNARAKPGAAERSRAWREANPAKARAYTRAWRSKNREATVSAAAKRRASIRGASGTHSASDVVAQFNAQSGACYYCASALKRFHVDHKTPIALGGSNGPENIVCACTRCNLSKGARTEAEFRRRMVAGLVPHVRKAG